MSTEFDVRWRRGDAGRRYVDADLTASEEFCTVDHAVSPVVSRCTAIIDERTMFRDIFVRSVATGSNVHPVRAFHCVEEFLRDELPVDAVIVIAVTVEKASDVLANVESIINELGQDTRVVLLADFEDADFVRQTLKAGAKGFVPTSLPLNLVLEAIELVRMGGVFLPASCLSIFHPRDKSRNDAGIAARIGEILSKREATVTQALLQGQSNKAIAIRLRMTEGTVKVHVRNIMRKLKARNRTEVAYLVNRYLQIS